MQTSADPESTSNTLVPLLASSLVIAAGAGALSVFAPNIALSLGSARTLAIAWAIGALLWSGWSAPTRGERRLAFFVALLAGYLALFNLPLTEMTPLLVSFVTLLVLATGSVVGGYIGSLLEYPGMLMVVAYVAAFADCFSVFHPQGLTANVLRNPKALALLTIPFPVLGTSDIASLVGIGDVTFVALYIAGARKTGLDPRRTLVALGVAMLGTAALVEFVGASLPALPFLGGAVVLAHPEVRRLPADQTGRIAANLAVVTLVLGGLLLSAALRGG